MAASRKSRVSAASQISEESGSIHFLINPGIAINNNCGRKFVFMNTSVSKYLSRYLETDDEFLLKRKFLYITHHGYGEK